MALTQGFKNLIKTVAIVAVVGGAGFFTHKNNYFGALDAKPEIAADETGTAGRVQDVSRTEPELELEQVEAQPLSRKARVVPNPVLADEPTVQPTAEDEPIEAPAPKHDGAINAMKGLDKL